jgi:hypothetical protein
VFAGGAPATLTNTGVIAGSTAADIEHGGSITNNPGASIAGSSFGIFMTGGASTVTNDGSISGSRAVDLAAGGTLTNASGATISGTTAGVFATGATATISNSGAINALTGGGTGLDIEAGGTITNNAGASIAGSRFGVFLSGGGTVTNAGAISGGSYAVDFASSGTNRLVFDPGATFTGGVNGGNGTLELATGSGSIGGIDTGVFNHFQTVDVDSGAAWTLSGSDSAPTLLNLGTIITAGSLDVSTAVDPNSTGLFELGSGSTSEFAADVGTQNQMMFLTNSKLVIDNAASFGINVGTSSYAGPQLQDFSAGDTIDLRNFSPSGATLNFNSSTGLLQVTDTANQAASLSFQTSSLGSGAFQIASDGSSGVLITHT